MIKLDGKSPPGIIFLRIFPRRRFCHTGVETIGLLISDSLSPLYATLFSRKANLWIWQTCLSLYFISHCAPPYPLDRANHFPWGWGLGLVDDETFFCPLSLNPCRKSGDISNEAYIWKYEIFQNSRWNLSKCISFSHSAPQWRCWNYEFHQKKSPKPVLLLPGY